jgi:hypothetical protein
MIGRTRRANSNGKGQRANGKWFLIFQFVKWQIEKPFEFCYLPFAI